VQVRPPHRALATHLEHGAEERVVQAGRGTNVPGGEEAVAAQEQQDEEHAENKVEAGVQQACVLLAAG